MRVGRWLAALGLALASLPAGAGGTTAQAAGAPEPVREAGYLTMDDGTQLSYTVVRPAGDGPFPTLFEYSGYAPGILPDTGYIRQFVVEDGGYAYIGVNLRGTGCSEGTFDFFQPAEALDGVEVIEWVTQQPWSDGKVAMIGKSYPGITQLFVAEQQPPGLVAIAPGHFFADAYRDVARPGGIINKGFSTLWSFLGQPSYAFTGGPPEVAQGNVRCANGTVGPIRNVPTNPFVQLLQHPYDDELIRERSPIGNLDQIEVPLLATLAWQDEQLASRQTHLISELEALNADRAATGADQTEWWATLTNGDHGMSRTKRALADLERFYDHFLKGENNGWDERPRVEVWWEAGRDGERAPGWVTELDAWGEAQRTAADALVPLRLHLQADGSMGPSAPPASADPTSYAYTPGVGSQGIGNPDAGYPGLPDTYVWNVGPAPGTFAAFTTEPLTTDQTFLGPASMDLWLAAGSTDIDVQVTLTEVRPDGQEQYVQKGWVRASQRALNPDRSTELRPFQTHQEADRQSLSVGEPVEVRVEIFPFGQVIRAGSRLRVWVEAPTVVPELWSFVPHPVAAQHQIFHDVAHPSALVLPLVANDAAQVASLATCGVVIRQPCRPDPLGVDGASSAPRSASTTSMTAASAPGDGGNSGAAGGGVLPATGGSGPIGVALVTAALASVLVRVRRAARPATGRRLNR